MSSVAKDNAFAAGVPVYDSAGNGWLKLRGGDPNQRYYIASNGHIYPERTDATSGGNQKTGGTSSGNQKTGGTSGGNQKTGGTSGGNQKTGGTSGGNKNISTGGGGQK
ncbi:uncharacterized protein B0H64DRAFT_446115 [Chaetomium fimeti]|uniref:Uncharacterized protein n=1 Tax=Chaetomium fimeti TaxID=1854472 RepID=A0AAE0H7Q1_9PEZI|nr:hypothetical protein B0H64DRAFT_446115 [Chaetomium fimeti]